MNDSKFAETKAPEQVLSRSFEALAKKCYTGLTPLIEADCF